MNVRYEKYCRVCKKWDENNPKSCDIECNPSMFIYDPDKLPEQTNYNAIRTDRIALNNPYYNGPDSIYLDQGGISTSPYNI